MQMKQYRPWEKKETELIISEVKDRKLPILDIQLSGRCSNHCIYCDDAERRKLPCLINMDSIHRLVEEGNIRGIYVCGIGEPFHCTNLKKLYELLDICSKKGIYLSMYSSLQKINKKLLDYIDNGILNILYKYDSEDINKIMTLYGQSREVALQYLMNYLALANIIHNNNSITNLGASIVPSSLNIKEMKFLINCCLKSGIFPMIGELENAGNCCEKYEQLKPDINQLKEIKKWLLEKHNIDYKIPTCPAVISGIHINNYGQVIIDKKTGLSCSWFWMENPQMINLGNIDNMHYDEIVDKIITYRDKKYEDVCQLRDTINKNTFGGCGGDIKDLLDTYTRVYKPQK